MSTISCVQCKDWEEFKSLIVLDLFGEDSFQRGRFLFRGQRSSEWSLCSSFDRWFDAEQLDEATRVDVANDLVIRFRKEVGEIGVDQHILDNDERRMALVQHYGLPTRLLDWTESPYNAAFFRLSTALVPDFGITSQFGH